jgi:ribosomal protein L11 methyltransferase
MYTEYFIDFGKAITEEESDIVVALLSQTAFESFATEETGVLAYIQTPMLVEEEIQDILSSIKDLYQFETRVKHIESVNWNEKWEKDYEPVFVNEKCVIRAPFHKIEPALEYDIVVEPKMAFGTGHHETTFLMSDFLFYQKLKRKHVCDAGTGSGILSIIASKLGAEDIFAYDIDEWSYNNTKENLKINKVGNVEVRKGDVKSIKGKTFDIVLANINRNILLKDVEAFSASLEKKGILIVSGFYSQDLPIIQKTFEKYDLKLDTFKSKNNWISAIFKKQ